MSLPSPLVPGASRPAVSHDGIGVKTLVLVPQASFPPSPELGQLVVLAADGVLYQWNGTAWAAPSGAGFLTKTEADGYYRQKSTYRHDQLVPSALWTITHNLGSMPVPVVQDSAGTTVEGDVTYINPNQMTIAFSAAFSGTAYLA